MDAYLSEKLLAKLGAGFVLQRETDNATKTLQNYHEDVRDFMLRTVLFFVKKDSGGQVNVSIRMLSKPEGIARSEFVFRYPKEGRACEIELIVRPLMRRINVVMIGICNKEVFNKHIEVHNDNEVLEEIWRLVIDELTS